MMPASTHFTTLGQLKTLAAGGLPGTPFALAWLLVSIFRRRLKNECGLPPYGLYRPSKRPSFSSLIFID